MPYTRTLIILANSYKHQARCVAGKSMRSGMPQEWIRPVNPAHHGGAVSERDIQSADGKGPRLLDIVNISFDGKSAHAYQPENHNINTNYYWDKIAVADGKTLEACVDKAHGPLWINDDSSFNGINDQMIENQAPGIDGSLRLIYVDNLSVSVISGWEGRKKVRGIFSLAGHHYNLGITDPESHAFYLEKGLGFYTHGPCYLCISISEPFNGYVYKLIAGIIRRGA